MKLATIKNIGTLIIKKYISEWLSAIDTCISIITVQYQVRAAWRITKRMQNKTLLDTINDCKKLYNI